MRGKKVSIRLMFLLGALVAPPSARSEQGSSPRADEKPVDRERIHHANTRAHSSEPVSQAQRLGRDVSGVFVNASAVNSGYSPRFVMRGFPSGLTLFDGASHGFTSQTVDLSTVDHVEFYKGPSAMLFGKAPGGYGGAANYIRKTPTEESFTRFTGTLGAFGVRRVTMDANRPLMDDKSLLLRVTGSAQSLGSFVDFVGRRGFDIAPMLTFVADNGDRLSLRAEHNAVRLVYRDGFPAAPFFFYVRREFYAGAPVNEHETPFYDDITLTYEHAFDRNWRLTSVVDYYLSANNWGWSTGWGYDGFQSVTLGRPARTREAVRNFDAQLRLDGQFDTGFLTHKLFFGLEHWDYFQGYSPKFARDAFAPINVFNPVYPLGVSYVGAAWANGVARAWSQSVYAQDLVDLTPELRILIGGRYDLLRQRERVLDPFGALSGQPTSSLSKGVKGYFSPRGGVLYDFSDETQLFAAFGQSLIPNISARLQSGEAPAPQRDTQYEIGFKRLFLDRKMTFEVGLFDITRDNVAIPNPANPSGFYDLVTGEQHSHGIEVNVGGEVLPNLRVNGSATFLHAQVTKDENLRSQKGSDLLGAPRRVYSLTANYTVNTGDLKGLDFGGSYYFASSAEATMPNTYGFVLAPQEMLGATVAYSFNDHVRLEVSAANLTNRANWTSNGALFYGEPRSVSASLNWRY